VILFTLVLQNEKKKKITLTGKVKQQNVKDREKKREYKTTIIIISVLVDVSSFSIPFLQRIISFNLSL
jgi:CRISPR/Cas system-associated protein Cas7 (RAMP superfamily)